MGSAWSRKQVTIESAFQAAPLNVTSWDLQHVKLLHDRFRDDGYEFGVDRASLRDLISSALPLARGVTGDLWDVFNEQGTLYPLELFGALALQCHGLSREKAGFIASMFEFGYREELSYDELAICISTVVGALSKLSGPCGLLGEKDVDKLADDAYVVAASDTSVPLPRSDFLKWVEKGLKIDLTADVTLEELGKALGVWSAEGTKVCSSASWSGSGMRVKLKTPHETKISTHGKTAHDNNKPSTIVTESQDTGFAVSRSQANAVVNGSWSEGGIKRLGSKETRDGITD